MSVPDGSSRLAHCYCHAEGRGFESLHPLPEKPAGLRRGFLLPVGPPVGAGRHGLASPWLGSEATADASHTMVGELVPEVWLGGCVITGGGAPGGVPAVIQGIDRMAEPYSSTTEPAPHTPSNLAADLAGGSERGRGCPACLALRSRDLLHL